jgi:hypothetical protein
MSWDQVVLIGVVAFAVSWFGTQILATILSQGDNPEAAPEALLRVPPPPAVRCGKCHRLLFVGRLVGMIKCGRCGAILTFEAMDGVDWPP